MTRLAVVGNSHVGAFKLGWEAISGRHPGVAVEFLAAPGTPSRQLGLFAERMYGVSPQQAAEHPDLAALVKRINGRTELDLGAFDCVLLVGRSHPLDEVVGILAAFEVDGLRDVGAPRRMSHDAFAAICDALAAQCLPDARWRQWRGQRMVVYPKHRPSEVLLDRKASASRHWRLLGRHRTRGEAGLGIYFAALRAQMATAGIETLEQPAVTIARSGLTARAFAKGSRRLVGGELHPDKDVNHMNADYGAICLETLLAQIAA